jgi:energy-coupling factor transporter ATP-binding protein EcfA2
MKCRSDILEKFDVVFAKYREESSADIKNIRDTLLTTLVHISKKSDDLIKQINSVKFKLDQAVDNHPRWLEHISKLQKLFEASHLTIEEIKCHQVLKAIAFQDIRTRRYEIGNVELAEDTFEWMVKDKTVPTSHQHLKQSFRTWLEEGEGIFHISGKPGSGKSTMMNFLANHPETRTQLDKWASNGNRIVTASMFLWNLGSVQQKNMDGVCRTLLYTILNDHKELIPHVFADLWNASSGEPLMSQQHLEMSRKEINTALQKLITDSTQRYQYCFFIDGLDEFHDEIVSSFRLASELVRWASHQGVKMCLSSREEAPWTNYFDKFPKLELHLTTEQDIRRMIDNYLVDDRHLKTFDTTESEKFVCRFVNMANGVFIWVKLVLQELEEELNYEAPLDALYQVLDTVPQKLEEFYERILLRISPRHKEEAWAVFDVLIETAKWNFGRLFNICHHSLLRDLTSDPDFYQRTSEHIAPRAFDRVNYFRNRVPLIFRGMVEVVPWGQFHGSPELDWLTFSHRSIYEYLSTSSSQRSSRSRVDIQIMIVKCSIGQVNRYGISSVDMSLLLGQLLFEIKHTYDDSMLLVLGLLDETLLRRQSKEFKDLFLDFHSSPNYIPTGKEQIPMVFFQSCEKGFSPYLHWAIHNSPYWRTNELFRATAIAALSSPEDITYHSPVEPLKILLGDGFGPNFWYTHPSFPCPISPWTRFLFYFIAKTAYKSDGHSMLWPDKLWPVLSTFIENNADLDLVFSWTIQRTSACPYRFYLKDIRVEKRICHDSQYPKTDTLFFQGKKFYVSRKFRLKFPRGGSAREILVHFTPKYFLPLLNSLD